MFAGGPEELDRYTSGIAVQTDDRMGLEFSAPRALSSGSSSGNAAKLLKLFEPQGGPPIIRRAWAAAGATEWRHRSEMLLAEHEYSSAYDAYTKTIELDPTDALALGGLVKTAVAAHRESQALDALKALREAHPRTAPLWVATSKLLAASGAADQAIAAAREARRVDPADNTALEQLASIFADLNDAEQLAPVVDELRQIQPDRLGTRYYSAALWFLRGQLTAALQAAQQTIALDAKYAPAHNLVGVIHANLGHPREANEAFQTALRLNPRDSATYVNLGLLELSSANRSAAAAYFAEGLSLDPKSAAARQGLAQSR
jgi:tetratricopeptide (TPR) repeat protein